MKAVVFDSGDVLEVFGVTIVSGVEKVSKPDPRIFHLLCERAGVLAEECVFIDDRLKNVEGAEAVGMDAIHFTKAAAREDALSGRRLLQ
ncbi:MAG: HAD-IA family hydrolase [Pseudomonadota bacterium]